jgi:hypothetical protein
MMLYADVSTKGVGLGSPPAESTTGFDHVVIGLPRLLPKQSGSLRLVNRLPEWNVFTAPRSRFYPDLLYRGPAGTVLVEAKVSGGPEGESVRGNLEIGADAQDFIGKYGLHAGILAITAIVRKALPACRIVVSLCGYGDESDSLLLKFKVLANMRGADAVRAENEIACKALEALGYDVVNRFIIVVR